MKAKRQKAELLGIPVLLGRTDARGRLTATGLEDALKTYLSKNMRTPSDAADAINRLRALENAAQRLRPENSRLFNIDLSAFDSWSEDFVDSSRCVKGSSK